MPDVSLLHELSKILGVSLENLLSGSLDVNELEGGNMKNLNYYVCSNCKNVLTATSKAEIACCGKTLEPLVAKKADPEHKLSVENVENDYFISSEHKMDKDHYISFVALLTGDSVVFRKQYSEWGLETRIPKFAHGKLIYYCTNHGLFYQLI